MPWEGYIIMLVKRKISTNINAMKFSIAGMFVENRKKLIYLSITMCCFIIFNILSQEKILLREADIIFTLADEYVLMAHMFSKIVYILPIYLLLLTTSLKNDTQTQFVIRKRSRSDIWKSDCIVILILAAYISLLETLIILMLGIIRNQKVINWTEEKTIFWIKTGTHMKNEVSIFCVALTFFITTMLTCTLIGMAYLFIKEIFQNNIITYGICICWGLVEYYSSRKLILNRLSMQFEYWLHKDYKWILCTIICVSILAYLSRKIVKRRQYYYEGNITI